MTLTELIFVALVYGSPVFMIGRILQVVLLHQYNFSWINILITLLIVQGLSLFLMLMIVKFWPFSFDVMLGIIAWPALFAELLLTALGYLFLMKFVKR